VEPEIRAYQRLLKKLAHLGIEKGRAEGPLEFERRVLREHPSPELQEVFQEWRLLRYASPTKPLSQLRQFQEHVRRLRLDSQKGQN